MMLRLMLVNLVLHIVERIVQRFQNDIGAHLDSIQTRVEKTECRFKALVKDSFGLVQDSCSPVIDFGGDA
jgi:hypothetical protein